MQQAKEAEYELTDYKDENGGSSVRIFLVSDLELGVACALKVCCIVHMVRAIYTLTPLSCFVLCFIQVLITTPTSSASGYYLLPTEDASTATLTVDPQEVGVWRLYLCRG